MMALRKPQTQTGRGGSARPGCAPGAASRARKRFLVLIALLHVGVLTLGLATSAVIAWRTLEGQTRAQICARNLATARVLGQTLDAVLPGRITPGSRVWDRVQGYFDGLRLPNDAYACLLDSDGKVICVPGAREQPELLGLDVSTIHIIPDKHSQRSTAIGDISGPIAGFAEMPSGRQLVAAQPVRSSGGTVIVHQPLNALRLERQKAMALTLAPIAGGGVALSALSVAVLIFVLRRLRRADAAIRADLEADIAREAAQADRARDALIFGLAQLADHRDTDTGAHLERIRIYSETLARELAREDDAIDDAWIRRLGLASSLHDIGKVGVPDTVLLKPGPLDAEERRIMEKHTTIAGDCLLELRRRVGEDDLLTMACEIALAHHERWDGGGYPYGLGGEDIPLAARIVALADVYDALTSDRVYKRAMSHEEARTIIFREAGSHFDPRVIEAFERAESVFMNVRDRLQGECASNADFFLPMRAA